jgi:exosortase/archaeosortase family protein
LRKARTKVSRKAEPNEQSSGQRPDSPWLGWRYPFKALAYAAVLFAAYFYPTQEGGSAANVVRSYLASYARVVGRLIAAFEPKVTVDGATIHGPLFSMMIVRTCDAMEVNMLLVAALAAFPMSMKRRLIGVPLALFILVLANTARLCVLYWLGAHAPGWFDRAHQTIAPLLMIATALLVFVLATRPNPRRPLPDPAAAPPAS